jgi:methionyl-tRNA synthetase
MPGDEKHRVYVWIDALFNYLSAVRASDDPSDRSRYWPAHTHVIAKDILWFHAVIWPALLMALGEALPGCVYAHSYWIREGRKMSKSLGNFLDFPTIRAYAERYGVDALRYYLLSQGPIGVTDADFSYEHFVEKYNADLANGVGNAHSRVTNMIGKYFGGKVPEPDAALGGKDADLGVDWRGLVGRASAEAVAAAEAVDTARALEASRGVSDAVDRFINETQPFKLAKDASRMGEVATVLYQCAEALRVACTLLGPAMPDSMAVAIERLGFTVDATDRFEELMAWGRLTPGRAVTKGEALFPRADAADPEPAAAPA